MWQCQAPPNQPKNQPSNPRSNLWINRELRCAKALQKDKAEGSSTPFHFDVLAQLANIPVRITLYEFLRLFKSMREAPREALADSEVFIAQISAGHKEEDEGHYLQTFKHFPCIPFTPEDMQIKGKHDIPLYYTGYIRSSEVSHIPVDPGFALSIVPYNIMQHLGIPTHRLNATQTTIYDFNANGKRSMGKINLRCHIGDLRSEVTCYVIDADTSYNLLSGRPWIHHNSIPSTLHQVMKYTDEDSKVRTLIAEKHPFKG